MKFKVGDKVRVKSWSKMFEEWQPLPGRTKEDELNGNREVVSKGNSCGNSYNCIFVHLD